jgi:sec-independent protein translocase protein TatB
LRTFGKTTSSLRKMAGDFRRQFDEALKEAELDDVREIANDLKGLDPRSQIKDALNPLGKIGEDISAELKTRRQGY